MSQQWGQAPSKSGGGGGSVRRARERMEAGLPPEMPPPPVSPYEQTRAAPPVALRPRPQAVTKNSPSPIGVAISRPTQAPQWPLAATVEGAPDPRTNAQYKPPAGRGPPPQRPPRPSHVPSMLDASQLQSPTPSFQYRPQDFSEQNQGRKRDPDDEISPDMISPMTMSSRPSTVSSVGSIPDFPVPQPVAGPPRRSANLGPPPSSRRGATSYYSQASYVSPIPEESPRALPSHGSYASSAAIPMGWELDPRDANSPKYRESQYEDAFLEEEDDDEFDADRTFGNGDGENSGRDSRESNGDDNDGRGLIRSASLGKRAKPTMVTSTKSPSVEPRRYQAPISPTQGSPDATIGRGLTPPDNFRKAVWPIIGNLDSPLANGTGLIDASDSSPDELPRPARAMTTNTPVAAYTVTAMDAQKASAIAGAYSAASSLFPGAREPDRIPSPGAGFSRLSAIRRPPRLDMDAVRDAEARGSLTSLPDLIRRATRLASMMDRGKRPGSRLNDLSDFPSDIDLSSRDKEMDLSTSSRRRSGLSGMIAAFPPPGAQTPLGGTPNGNRPVSSWPTGYETGTRGMGWDVKNGQSKKRGSRCCGLPCWGFMLVLLILLIIIAAAVVVPLELLVIHKPKASTASTLSQIQQCEAGASTACQNGGSSLIDNGSCACICTNGFTGSTCTTASSVGCSTTTFTNSGLTNVTMGDSISRIITGALSNFSIPLSESIVIARFNSANLSCASENALVTFDGRSERIGKGSDAVTPTTTTSSSSAASSTVVARRHYSSSSSYPASASTSTSDAAAAVATNNGIIYDSSSAPAAASTSSSSSPCPSSTATFVITEEVLDFARVAVLYILQQEQLDSAVNAQTTLQKFFSLASFTNEAAKNFSLGNGNKVDLVGFSVTANNGTVGLTSSKRRRSFRGGRSLQLWT